MHIDGHKFLVSVVEPLQLTVQVLLENETADQLGLALQGHLSIPRARGFQPSVVYVDTQSGFRALKNMFPSILIDDSGAADYIPKVESEIRRIKELYRVVKNESTEINGVKTFMMREFKWITVIQEKIQSYLGMNVEVQEHKIIVDMEYFTQQLLSSITDIKEYHTPAVKECFQLEESSALDTQGQKTFHTIMAKLLYLAKQARPDILTATSFLCTRVKQPTKNDQKKLLRVLGYLEATKHYKYTIAPMKPFGIITYIDAAFATHEDSMSHSEVAIFVAGVLVYTSSKKQACVAKVLQKVN